MNTITISDYKLINDMWTNGFYKLEVYMDKLPETTEEVLYENEESKLVYGDNNGFITYDNFKTQKQITDINPLRFRVISVAIRLSGGNYEFCSVAIAEFADKKLRSSVRCIFRVEEIAAYEHVINTAVMDVLHHFYECLTKTSSALVALLGSKSEIRHVKMHVGTMKKLKL